MEKRRTETTRPEASWILADRGRSYTPIIYGVILLVVFGLAVIVTRL